VSEETNFLGDFWNSIDRMTKGARIVLGIDPCPPPHSDPGKQHPFATARQDAFHFVFRRQYPDQTGQIAKGELVALLAGLLPHPTIEGYLSKEIDGVLIRFEVGNMVLFNPKRLYILDGKLIEGCYEDLRGISIRCWGLDAKPTEQAS
jgi:hypothetical protein